MNTNKCKQGHIVSASFCPICETKPEKKKRVRIPFASEKRKAELKVYSQLGKQFLIDNKWCQVEGCGKHSVDLHHTKGRGKHLNDVSTWMAVCRYCHENIHNVS